MTRKFTRHTYDDVEPYVTKDGSLIRELMHPNAHGNKNQSLAEATIKAGATTESHRHRTSEEIYYIIEGTGIVIIYRRRPLNRGEWKCPTPNFYFEYAKACIGCIRNYFWRWKVRMRGREKRGSRL